MTDKHSVRESGRVLTGSIRKSRSHRDRPVPKRTGLHLENRILKK